MTHIKFIKLYIFQFFFFFFYILGKPSDDPQHPDYVPSIFCFKPNAIEEAKKKLKRYERNAKRARHDLTFSRNLGTDNGKFVIIL